MPESNRKILEMYKKLWSKIKKQLKCNFIETNNSIKWGFAESIKYEKDPIKIRSDSFDDNDDLPLDKVLCLSDLIITVEPVFQIKDKYDPQIHILECEYE